MGKGSSPSGSTTSSTVNPTAAAQLPYLQDVWGKAQNLYNQQPGITPALTQAYQDYANTGTSIDQNLRPVTNATYNTALTGGYGVQNSPAYPYLNPLAAGTTAPQTTLATYGAQAASPTGPGYDQLAASARGDYLNSNPYLGAAITAAQDPTMRAYQTATDPTTRYNFSTAGRYGSPALEGAGGVRSTNELNLAKSLGDIATNISSADYSNERKLQDAAAGNYVTGQNYGLGIGIDAANKNLAGQEYGAGALQTGYQAGNQAALTGLGYTPSVTDANLAGSKANIAAGTGLLSSTYAPLQDYSGLAGQPAAGSSSTTSPYFQNATANTLSALTGTAGLGNTLAGGGGLGGLFGGGAGGIGAFGSQLSGGAAESLLAAPGAAFLDASGGTGLATLASAAPAAGKSAASAAPLLLL